MYLRDTDFPTLVDVYQGLDDHRRTWGGSSTSIAIQITEVEDSPDIDEGKAKVGTIGLGDHEVPVTRDGLQALAQYFEVPYKFLARIPRDEQQFILDHRIQRGADRATTIRWDEHGIHEVYPTSQSRLSPQRVAEGLLDIFPEDAPVIDWWNTPDDFRIDVVVPEGFDRGIGGDKKVGDFTHGGVRVGQDRKRNLAPWTQTLLFRLACTNGMEIPDYGLRVDARGAEAYEVEMMLLAEVKRAFDRVEKDIRDFYELRHVKAEADHTGLFRRMTREIGVPDRMIGRMENTLPDALLAEEEVTMFHLVNHLTNEANNPALRSHPNQRRELERAGGIMLADHTARCDLCHSRLN